MEPLMGILLAVLISIAGFATSIRNCIQTKYTEAVGPAFWKLLMLDLFIIVSYTVCGMMLSIMIFKLPVMQPYSDYAMIVSILVGVSFREILPFILGSFQAVIKKKFENLEKQL